MTTPPDKYCNGQKRHGGLCKRPAGWGTDHVGYGRCKLHGGCAPGGRKAASRLAAEDYLRRMAVAMGPAVDIEPHEALLTCVRIAAGEVQYTTYQIEKLGGEDVLVNPRVQVEKEGSGDGDGKWTASEEKVLPLELNIWVKARHDALDRLARFSKMALDAGVAERQVQLAEKYGQQLGDLLKSVLDDLDLTPAQQRKVPEVIQKRLLVLERSNVAA